MIDATSTAPEEISLAFLAPGWCSLVNESTIVSMAEFVSSKPITMPIVSSIISHSEAVICR